MHEDNYVQQELMHQPLTYLLQSDLDTMHFHQVMKELEKQEFVKAIVLECCMGNEAQARHQDRQQQKGVNYWETYTPVVTWFAVCLLLVLSLLHNWQTRQVDFITAYPQTPIECDLWMHLPAGIETKHGNSKTHVLKLEKNLYGQKQTDQVWNQYLTQKLLAIRFKQSKVDECFEQRAKGRQDPPDTTADHLTNNEPNQHLGEARSQEHSSSINKDPPKGLFHASVQQVVLLPISYRQGELSGKVHQA
eukprot:12434992-Ditylum_brightwellii.AAC.3